MFEIEKLSVRYKNSENYAVNRVSFSISEGEFIGVVGESGSGKSTMVHTALGLLPAGAAAEGSIIYKGKNLLTLEESGLNKIRWNELALVPQGAMNSFTPVLTIGHHIYEVLKTHKGLSKKEARPVIEELLADAELEASVAERYPHELSGGQKQRAAIALALACSPSLLFADEPTTALDVVTQASVLKLLSKLRKEKNLAIMLVSHDLPMASSVCDNLYVMKNGILVEHGPARKVINEPSEEYTQKLVKAMFFR